MAKIIKETDRTFSHGKVRLIDSDGSQIGIVEFSEARSLAKGKGLDLVLVADRADPPVVRIMDYGKLVYEQKKKVRSQKRHHHVQRLKEVKFHVNTDEHDYRMKIDHAIGFFKKGDKVKATVVFRGREMAHKDIGFEIVSRIIDDLKEHGTADNNPRMAGRNLAVTFTPVKN